MDLSFTSEFFRGKVIFHKDKSQFGGSCTLTMRGYTTSEPDIFLLNQNICCGFLEKKHLNDFDYPKQMTWKKLAQDNMGEIDEDGLS